MSTQTLIKPYVIGLDLGGTNSVFGIVDTRGDIKATTAIKTQGYETVEDYVAASVEALQVIIDQVGGIETIKAMGIGAPNANYYRGTIEQAPNIVWGKGIVPLADLFSKALGIPVAMTNDANAAAIGEMTYGAAKGMKNFIMITLGTGVGSGISGRITQSPFPANTLAHRQAVSRDIRRVSPPTKIGPMIFCSL